MIPENEPIFFELPSPDTDILDLFNTQKELIKINPGILEEIENDQDLYAKKKKKIRLEEKNRRESKLQPFSACGPVEEKEIQIEDIKLEHSDNRMDPFTVFFFLLLRGYLGGIKGNQAWNSIKDSMTIHNLLLKWGTKLPGKSTIIDNINLVSNCTRQLILDAQISLARGLGLDDFKKLTIDSTAVEGNTSWPTDSDMLRKLIARIWHCGKSLDKFGIAKMPSKQFASRLVTVTSLAKQIALNVGKPHSKEKIKNWYLELLGLAESVRQTFVEVMPRICDDAAGVDLPVSKKQQLMRLIEKMEQDLSSLKKVLAYCEARIVEEKTTKAKDKVLSMSDVSAAYIAKGSRDPVIGYKPQLGRSANGFVTCLIVPEGNAADVSQLIPMLDEHIRITDVIPNILNVDDGYSGKAVKEEAELKGVDYVSISGAKGKKITSEEDWESEIFRNARNDRSAVESLMFCLKFSHNFGRVMRRGIDSVRAELMEKVIVYNALRIVRLQKQNEEAVKNKAA